MDNQLYCSICNEGTHPFANFNSGEDISEDMDKLLHYICELCCQKQVSQTGISNYIP